MLPRRSLMLSLLLVTASSGADDVQSGVLPASPAGAPTASAVASGPEAGEPSRRDVAQGGDAAPDGTAQNQAAKDGAAKKDVKAEGGDKTLSGMSILGNQEAPKSLVIVPWKSSQLGDSIGLAQSLDDGRGPVDKEVFMRQLDYYEIRSGSK
jgi:hypothetical protein